MSPALALTRLRSLAQGGLAQPQLYRVRHWYETGEIKDSERPEVNRLEPMVYTPMDEAIQWMCFDRLFWHYRHGDRSFVTADEKRIFQAVFGSHTFINNYQGVDVKRNYISGENMGADLPGYMSLVMGGAVLTGTEYIASSGARRLQADVLTGARDIASVPPWQVQHATIFTTRILAEGCWQVNPFDQLGGRYGYPVIVPILCREPVSFPMWKLEKLPPGAEIPNPYVPAWSW